MQGHVKPLEIILKSVAAQVVQLVEIIEQVRHLK